MSRMTTWPFLDVGRHERDSDVTGDRDVGGEKVLRRAEETSKGFRAQHEKLGPRQFRRL